MKNSLILLVATFFCAVSYAQQTETITFQHDGITVNGVFTKPSNGATKFPVIIVNPGTGANDKDGTLQMVGGNIACLYPGLLNETLHFYKELGDALVDSGYAVLRYDKLEYTYASNIAVLDPITFHKLWLPVESAIDYVKTRSDVDINQIILIGHSEGSSLIPHIAKTRTDIKALISLAGPRQPLDSMLAYQLPYIAQTCGGDVATANAQASQILAYFNDIRTNNWNTSTPPAMGVSAATWYDYIRVVDSVSFNYNSCNLPTLFLGLGLDFNVPPSELVRFQNEVTITNDFWSIPNLIHYMTPNNDPHVSEQLTDTIVHWLRGKNITSIKKISSLEKHIYVSPNPFQKNLLIEIRELNAKKLDLQIIDVKGAVVYRELYKNINTNTRKSLTLENLANGIYFLKIETDKDSLVQKIVKE